MVTEICRQNTPLGSVLSSFTAALKPPSYPDFSLEESPSPSVV